MNTCYIQIIFSTLLILPLCETSCKSKSVSTYKSEFGQDQFVNEKFFKNKKGGTFVDIGAHDGLYISNSWFFEKELGWSGICIEPRESAYTKLVANRSCICIKGAITPEEGVFTFRECTGKTELLSGIDSKYNSKHTKLVKKFNKRHGSSCKLNTTNGYVLNDLFEKHSIKNVDYLSLDVEGGELDILKSIDFDRYYIYVIDVENNYYSPDTRTFLESKGFTYIARKKIDEIYVNSQPYKGSLFE